MSTITALLEEYQRLYGSGENTLRLKLWTRPEEGIRWENQWHGLPGYTSENGRAMPVTAECLDKIWEKILGLDMKRYFTEPDYYLEYYLKMRLQKFRELPDDTPLTLDIPLVFGVTHEAGVLGQKVFFTHGEEPTFSRDGIVDEDTVFPKSFDFNHNEYLGMVIPFYKRMKDLAGKEFRVIFPQWYRGPQGVALYIRGFQEFSLDLYTNEAFARRLLRYVTDAAKAYALWRRDFTGESIMRGDLFNDDIPLMSPDMYDKFFFDYEKEMSDFYGGIFYWHSCGDITPHVSFVHQLPDIDIVDFGVSMEDKGLGIKGLKREQVVEFRVKAQTHVQQCTDEGAKEHVRKIIRHCKEASIQSYVLRSSGMSVVFGADKDLQKLARWVELVREVQAE